MSVWERYTNEQQQQYVNFLEMYGSLSGMFNQKSSESGAPYLDSKFQETVYARSFDSKDVDTGNTPHDIKSDFSDGSVGIGIKTWLNSKPSFQKVMQLKKMKNEIEQFNNPKKVEELAYKIASIKNDRLDADYARLGLKEDDNIYHYVTRDEGKLVIQETSYPKIDIPTLQPEELNKHSFTFCDRYKSYKYTFGDSQVWMKFGGKNDSSIIDEVKVDILKDPFDFMKTAFEAQEKLALQKESSKKLDYTYLPLYSYSSKQVEEKSGLNAFNAAPKNVGGDRPEAEVYIPIPMKYWKKHPNWFNKSVDMRNHNKYKMITGKKNLPFKLHLPNGEVYPAHVGQSNFKALETDPQNALGKWLLYDIFKLAPGELLTNDKLIEIGLDSVKLWHEDPDDFSNVWIDFAPLGSFEKYMSGEIVDDLAEDG